MTQGLNPGLLHCRKIPYHLSHKGSPSWKTAHLNFPENSNSLSGLKGWSFYLEVRHLKVTFIKGQNLILFFSSLLNMSKQLIDSYKRKCRGKKITYKLNKDLGVYYSRVIIQAGFEKNFCLISHCNQVSMGISVNAWNRQPINHVYSQHNNWRQVLCVLDFLYSKYKTGSYPVLFLEQKANPLSALGGPWDSSSLDV